MKIKILLLITLVSVYSCTAISEKATEKAAKENAYLSTFLKAPSANLVKTFGKPTQTLAENDQTIYVYEVKGKVFNCQRKFTIDNKNIVSGFVSTCWD
jgi:hypothetical protein